MPSIVCSDDTKAELTEILRKFLSDIQYELPVLEMDPTVTDQVNLHLKEAGFSDEDLLKLARTIQTAVGLAVLTYQTVPFDVQVTVAIYTVYNLIIDDRANGPEFRKDLNSLNTRLLTGKPPGISLLQSYDKFLATMHETFGQFPGDMIIKDTPQFMSGSCLEAEGDKTLKWPVEAPEFANYFRLKVGLPEGFAFMLFPTQQFTEEEVLRDCLPVIPYLVSYINWLNDIMSLYKEVVEVENCIFINNSAKAQGLAPLEFLRKLCDDTVGVVRILRTLGKDNSRLGRALEAYIQGYIVYHFTQKRYRLADLGLPLVSEAQERVSILLQ